MADIPDESMFASMKVAEIKLYLRKHGQLYSGNKTELVRRARGTFQLVRQRSSTELTEPVENNEVEETSAEYRSVAALDGWEQVEDVQMVNWPNISDKELYDYLVYTCKKTCDFKQKKARRQTKANVFYEDGHVHSVRYHPVPGHGDECYIKCLVIPSAASSDKVKYPDRSVWVRVSKITARVNSGYCTCTAGIEGSCNHVAALLYATVDITIHKKEGLDASTSKACKWKLPRKRKLSPRVSHDFPHKWTKSDRMEKPQSRVDLSSFSGRLKMCAPKSGWLTNFKAPKTAVLEIQLPSTATPNFMYADYVDISSQMYRNVFEHFAKQQYHSAADRLKVEQATKEQRNSSVWYNYRMGKVTSSYFGKVCKRRSTTPPDSLVKMVMNYGKTVQTKHMEWGTMHETAAKRCYLNTMKRMHPGIKVYKAGLVLDEQLPFLASSPDAFVTCHHCSPTQGLLEVKCPSVFRDKTPVEACQEKNFCCQLVDGKVTLKRNHDYYYQVQGQMGITGRKWCDFVVWTPKGLAVERIRFDSRLWEEMVTLLRAFYVQCIVPELFTGRLKRGRQLY